MPAAARRLSRVWSMPRWIGLTVIVLATNLPWTGRAMAEPMGELRLDATLTVRGLSTLEPHRLAKALANDDDLLLLSRPQANRRLFLSAVGRKATLAVQHAGFETAKATAAVESGSTGERLVVNVVEGPRTMAGGVEITGLPDDLAGGLQRWLQGQRPPPGSIAETVDGADGWGGVRWVDENGRTVTMEAPLWTRGEPAAFDPPHLKQIRTAIGRFLRDQGRFSAAVLVEDRKPTGLLAGLSNLAAAARFHHAAATTATVDVAVKPGPAGAVLAVSVTNLPPAAVLEDVRLPTGTRTTREALLAALGITQGAPVTEHDRVAWKQRLRMSGRFLRSEVTLEPSTDGGHGVTAVFDLEDYASVGALGTDLTREEAVMLRFRDWLLATLSGDEDIVAAWERAPNPGETITVGQPTGEFILSSNDGMLVSMMPESGDASGVAVTVDGIGCFLPGEAGRFEIPLPSQGCMTAQIALSLAAKEKGENGNKQDQGYRRQLTLGVGYESRSKPTAAPFAITARIEPAACLAIVHEGEAKTRWEGETLVVESTDLEARFDGPTGRLLVVETDAGQRLSIRAAAGDLATTLAALRAAAGDDRARSEALITSGVDFFTAAGTAAAIDRTFAASGLAAGRSSPKERFEHFASWLQKEGLSGKGEAAEQVIARAVAAETTFPDRFVRIFDMLRRIGAAGGFTQADALLADAIGSGDGEEALTIPHERGSEGDPLMTAGKLAATTAWRTVEETCGRDCWLAALARLAALGVARDPAALEELSTFMAADQAGPIAYLTAATGVPIPLMAASLARRGQEKLSTAAFHADCAPVLELLRSRKLDRSLVVMLRTLTNDDAKLLGEMAIGDGGFLLPLLHDLHARPTEAAATAALPESLDRWWDAALGKVVATALNDKVSPRTAAAPAADEPPVR